MFNKLHFLSILLLGLIFSSNCFGQTPYKEVIAQKGEGVFSILRKNGVEPVKYYKEFIKINRELLKSDSGLIAGKRYLLPIISISDSLVVPKDSTRVLIKKEDSITVDSTLTLNEYRFPIFGKKYETVIKKDDALDGAVYYLISGHGGPDPGALEKQNGKLIAEDEYAYDVTLRLARKLRSHGATVYIIIKDLNDGIRDERLLEIDYDERNYSNTKIARNQKLRLKQRTEVVNKLFYKHQGAYQRLIVTHIDSRSKGTNIDVFFYHHERSKKGKNLAENIHQTFKKKYARYQPNRTYAGTVSSRSSLYLVKKTLPPMVYIELGNIRNKKDQRRILDYDNRQAMAKWIGEGLISDFTNSDNKK